jgi:ankyrin repeat protein
MLVRIGVDINTCNPKGYTPLMNAVYKDNLDIMNFLLGIYLLSLCMNPLD